MARKRDGRRLEEVTGRRAETIEWGVRQTHDDVFGKAGQVQPCGGEARARQIVDNPERRYWRTSPVEVVKRTVVTYTTSWEPAPVSTVPPLVDMVAVLEGRAELPWRAGAGQAEDPQGEVLF